MASSVYSTSECLDFFLVFYYYSYNPRKPRHHISATGDVPALGLRIQKMGQLSGNTKV